MNPIFSHFIARGDTSEDMQRLAHAIWFTDALPPNEFDGDELLFYNFLSYCSSLDVPVVFKYLQVWCDTELRETLHTTQCRVPGCESLRFDDPASFETIYQTTSKVLLDDFKVLETIQSEPNDFKVDIAAYFSEARKRLLTKALSGTFERLNDTDNVEDAADYVMDEVSIIKDVYDDDKLDELDSNYKSRKDATAQMEKVTDCGIPAIDNDSVGLFTTQLFDVDAQSGKGKTRFVLGTYVYRALTLYRKNVCFCALEQKVGEVEAMLIAHHVFVMFNIQMSDKMILTNTVPDEIKSEYEAAKYDLFESGKYGKFYCTEYMLYVETFVSKFRTLDKLQGPFDLFCIDYIGIMESKPAKYARELTRTEVIQETYKRFKRYVRNNHKAGIAISQLNHEGTVAGDNDKEISIEMIQGGMAAGQNADYNIAITATSTMMLQQKRRVGQPKVRSSAGFPRFMMDVRLGFLYFKQISQDKV